MQWIADSEPSVEFPIYTRGNAGEVFGNVVTPLTWSLESTAVLKAQIDEFVAAGFFTQDEVTRGLPAFSGVFGGYLYLNLSLGRLAGVRTPSMSPDAVDTQLFGTHGAPPYRRRRGDRNLGASLNLVRRVVQTLRVSPLDGLDDARRAVVAWLGSLSELHTATDDELLSLVATLPPRLERTFATLLRGTSASATGRGFTERILTGRRRPNPVSLTNRMLSGLGSIDSAALATRLWDLGRVAHDRPAVGAMFDAGVVGLAKRMAESEESGVGEFRAGFDDFLRDHGHRCADEYELASPCWSIDPDTPLAHIERLRRAPVERAPALAGARLAADAEAATREAVDATPRPLRRLLKWMLRSAIEGAAARERAKEILVLDLQGARWIIHELFIRAQRRGGPTHLRDCYLVTVDELADFVREPTLFTALIAERAEQRDYLAARVPPFWFEGQIPDPSTWKLRPPLATAPATSARVLTGIGVCGGVATGRARVVLDPSDPRGIEPTEVLVARITDPAWTPLFLSAVAVVVDVGAQQSHAAIVARELGIPAVVSVTDASSTIADGTMLTVNGDTGEVTIHIG